MSQVDRQGIYKLAFAAVWDASDHGEFARSDRHQFVDRRPTRGMPASTTVAIKRQCFDREVVDAVETGDRVRFGTIDALAHHVGAVFDQGLIRVLAGSVIAVRPAHPPAALATKPAGKLGLQGLTP